MTEEKNVKPKPTIKTHKRKEVKPLVYCGPTINGELQQFAVFKDGIPEHIKTRIEECKSIESLFVTTDKLAKTRSKLQVKGTRENQLFKKVNEYLKEV